MNAEIQTQARNELSELLDKINNILIDKEEEVRLCLCAILSGGHVLLEGAPGMGKTSLVKSFVKSLGLESARVQFTNDMLPADIIGASVFEQKTSEFKFHKGPLFTNLLIADELNRATPKTQSACLQAMEEGEVDIDGNKYKLPKPFYVFATQNPEESVGTFPLPESQLDRFFMRIKIGLPTRKGEKDLLLGKDRNEIINSLDVLLSGEALLRAKEDMEKVHISDSIVEYILDIIEKSRSMADGLSPRASQDLIKGAKAFAYIEGRDFVVPEDVQRVAVAIMNHRIGKDHTGVHVDSIALAEDILSSVKIA